MSEPTSSTVPHVFAAINAVQKALAKEGITKDRKNAQQGYSFRGIDDIFNALSSLLAENQLVMLPTYSERTVTERETKTGGTLFGVTLKGEFTFTSAKDGSTTKATLYGEAMDSADKATNKAMSAAYKYAALQAFCIPTEGDNDADATTHELASSKAKTAGNGASTAKKPAAEKKEEPLGKPVTALANKDQLKKLAAYRTSEAGERAVTALLTHWKLKDFDQVTEEEATQAIIWIDAEVKKATAKPATATK
jgi:hypothetical protein